MICEVKAFFEGQEYGDDYLTLFPESRVRLRLDVLDPDNQGWCFAALLASNGEEVKVGWCPRDYLSSLTDCK